MLFCKHCNKECKNKNSLVNHERLCKLNPNKEETWLSKNQEKIKRSNQHIKSKETGIPYIVTEDTRLKLSKSSSEIIWSEERRAKHSESMKRAVTNNPNSYTCSNRGRTKQIIVDGIKFQGKWELDFYQYCKDRSIQIERSNEWFEYEWNGTRKYFPDFYLKDKDLYIEVKGYETERDRAKWSAFPKRLKIIRNEDILSIRKGNWDFS